MASYNVGQGVQGGVTGAGTGFALGGPPGAAAGGILGLLGGFGGQGKPEKLKTFDPYSPQQRDYSNSQLQGAQGQQGNILSYLNSILSDDPQAMAQFENPAIQNFQRKTLPGIAERFAGMNAGSSSALNQTLGEAGNDLQMNLAQHRANLKQQALQHLLGMGQQGLQGQLQPYIKGSSPGLMSQLNPIAAQGFQQMGEQGSFKDILGWLQQKLSGGMPATAATTATSSGVTGGGNSYGLPGFMQ